MQLEKIYEGNYSFKDVISVSTLNLSEMSMFIQVDYTVQLEYAEGLREDRSIFQGISLTGVVVLDYSNGNYIGQGYIAV